ncbi:hypothetical protein JCM3774_006429 [Rhodotorula dairenensis]
MRSQDTDTDPLRDGRPAPAEIPQPLLPSPQIRSRSNSNAPTLVVSPSPSPSQSQSPSSSTGTGTPTQHSKSPLAQRLARRGSDTDTPTTHPASLSGYDNTTRRNLIARAAADGDLARLEALVLPASRSSTTTTEEDEQPARSVFALANDPNPHTGLAPIHYAAQNGHDDVVKWLVDEAGAMPDLEDAQGETPLHKAALRGHLDVCRFLLSRQVQVDAADNDGWTPLHNASSRGWLDVARLLLTFAADPDAANRHGFTPLMNAASKGHLPLVHFLLRQGACDPLRRNVSGETAYDLAASVFELEICRVLAAAETTVLSRTTTPARTYNPLALHTTVPVVVYENQRLATRSLRRPASLVSGPSGAAGGDHLAWSSKALSRTDRRAAFSLPRLGTGAEATAEAEELPCFRSEVGLPVVGNENELVLPPRREIRSGGRVKVVVGPSSAPSPSQRRPDLPSVGVAGPSPRRSSARSAASSSLAAVLASTSPRAADDDGAFPSSASRSPPAAAVTCAKEPAWMWISDWTVDLTSPLASPQEGWSYAPSFDTPEQDWTPVEKVPASTGSAASPTAGAAGGGGGGGGAKTNRVRRRLWMRVMRRRLDLPDWGFGAEPADTAPVQAEEELAPLDYRSRARFLVGQSLGRYRHLQGDDSELTDSEAEGPGAVADRVDLRKRLAQLERAADELRRGIAEDPEPEQRREAEGDLEELLRTLALLRSRGDGDAAAASSSDADESDFLYTGVDAAEEDDDTRSVWTSTRPPSVGSSGGARLQTSRSASFQSTSSNRPVLTPQTAPDFRIPTHEVAAPSRHFVSPPLQMQSLRPVWEPDHAASACRRCGRHFSLLNRRHHCRRCGLVVCAACSPHSDQLDPRQVAVEPGTVADDSPWLLESLHGYRYRTCNECHAALALLQPSEDHQQEQLPSQAGPASLLSPQAFFPSSSLPGSAAPSEAAASDVSELVECPVCGEPLAQLGEKSRQEDHVRDCLEAGRGSIASGRYLVFRLPPGPLVGEDCTICWTEFEIGDKMARLVCLCTFHEKCLGGWLARGNSCPVHAIRD